MVGLGVSDKVKDPARQTFERSAEQAGFFAHRRNRLVMPVWQVRQNTPPPPPAPDEEHSGRDGKKMVAGLVTSETTIRLFWGCSENCRSRKRIGQRLKWLQTAANIFDLVYKGEGGIVVSLARAERSPRHDE
jgi:hypothetical protein